MVAAGDGAAQDGDVVGDGDFRPAAREAQHRQALAGGEARRKSIGVLGEVQLRRNIRKLANIECRRRGLMG